RITVLYNEPALPEDHPDYISEVEVIDNVEAVQEVLSQAGYDTTRLAVGNDAQALITGLREHAPDAVVNLFEGTADNNANEMYAAGILEWLGVSYTGCPFHTIVLARSKHQAKRLFQAAGIPTAPFLVVEGGEVADCPLRFPCIVKPTQQDASVGVEQKSVVTDLAELRARVRFVHDQFAQPVLVEEFIPGRELTVALVEMPDLRVLPGTEVVFPTDKEGYWPILTYDAKWDKDSMEFNATDYHFHAQLTPDLLASIQDIARRAFRLLGCRDYARVDFRIRAGDDQPFVLELNPNPDFAPDRALANNLWAAGIQHDAFVRQLAVNALARRQGQAGTRYQTRAAS
ncbi:MAG: D-alanine--D-alanine ligase family protein, partial [Gemmataceae bacterium]